MKLKKRILCLLVTLILSISLLPNSALAASYPFMAPKEFEYTVTQGETVKMEFTVFHVFKNEKAHVRVHQGSKTGTIVSTSDRSLPGYSRMTDYSVTWDTSNVQPGEYVVEYWMSFYTMYEWHEQPTRWPLLKINVKAAPCENGHNNEIKTEGIPAKFNDVDSNAYYAPAIDWALDKGVAAGTTGSTFSPNDECTRGQVLTFLWRAMGSPNPKTSENPFDDINSNEYYYKAILWGIEQGITCGTSTTTFSPEETCSYAQILTFIWRSQGKPNFTGNGEWYEDALVWSSNNGLLEETNATSNVESSCPRKDVVTYLYRILDEEGRIRIK